MKNFSVLKFVTGRSSTNELLAIISGSATLLIRCNQGIYAGLAHLAHYLQQDMMSTWRPAAAAGAPAARSRGWARATRPAPAARTRGTRAMTRSSRSPRASAN